MLIGRANRCMFKSKALFLANVGLMPKLVRTSRFILPGALGDKFLLSGLLVLPSWELLSLQLVCVLAVLLNGHKQFRIIFPRIIIAICEDYRENRLKATDIKKW